MGDERRARIIAEMRQYNKPHISADRNNGGFMFWLKPRAGFRGIVGYYPTFRAVCAAAKATKQRVDDTEKNLMHALLGG